MKASTPAYVPAVEMKSYFSDTFSMPDDCIENLDILLKHGFIESNNRIDLYTDRVDAVKITNYGLYTLETLSSNITYLDLVSTDCGVYAEETSNYLTESAKQEFVLFMRRDRLSRVEKRLERLGEFVRYLEKEEHREREAYSLGMPLDKMFTYKIRDIYDSEKKRVLASAKRQRH